MLASVHRPIGDKSMRMVRSAADHRLDILLLEALAPVRVLFGLRKFLRPERQVFLVHIAKCNDVLAGDASKMGFATAPRSDKSDVQLIAGSVRAEEPCSGKDQTCGAGVGHGFEEVPSFHAPSLAPKLGTVKTTPVPVIRWPIGWHGRPQPTKL